MNLPDDWFDKLRRLAKVPQLPIEQLVREQYHPSLNEPLPQLPASEQAELAALSALSDDALWAVAAEQMAPALQARMATLMGANSRGEITADELQELEQLVERGDQLMLRKAQAALLLKQRGYQVTQNDLALPHD